MQALFVNSQYPSAVLASPYTNLAVKQKLTAKERKAFAMSAKLIQNITCNPKRLLVVFTNHEFELA